MNQKNEQGVPAGNTFTPEALAERFYAVTGTPAFYTPSGGVPCPWHYQIIPPEALKARSPCEKCRMRTDRTECRRQLPTDYGRYPTVFVPVVGVSGAGKTLYIRELLRQLNSVMGRIGRTIYLSDEARGFIQDTVVEPNKLLPMGTTNSDNEIPLYLHVETKENRFTVVLRDITGYDCVNRNENALGFIQRASGVILLIDPHQFPDICYNANSSHPEIEVSAMNVSGPDADPESVMDALHTNFGFDGEHSRPLALTLTKSMYLKKLIGSAAFFRTVYAESQCLFREMQWNEEGAFPLLEYHRHRAEICALLEQVSHTTYEKAKQLSQKVGLFAVESLGSNTVMLPDESGYTVENEPVGRGVAEPLIWILAECGLIPKK